MTRSAYTPELAAKFCAAVAEGDKSIREICKLKGMPCKATVFEWLRDHDDFRKMYEIAKDEQADTFIDEMVEIADKCAKTKPAIAKARLQIYARELAAAKMKPRKYGTKIALGGADDLPPLKSMTDDELATKIAEKMAKLGNDGA
jgi:transposase-like protein